MATTETKDYSDDFDTDSSSNNDNTRPSLPSERSIPSCDDEPIIDPRNSGENYKTTLNLKSRE